MDAFVGFAASPKPREGAKVQSLNFEISSKHGIKNCLVIATSQLGLESWLGKFEKFDFRQGAKLSVIRAEEKTGLSFAQINIPRSVILVTEVFGQVEFSFKEMKDSVRVSIGFRKAVTDDELDAWSSEVEVAKSVILGALCD